MQFLKVSWRLGQEKENRESAFLSKILLFKTEEEQDVRKQFQLNLLEQKI